MRHRTRLLTLRTVSVLTLVAVLAALTPAFLATHSEVYAQETLAAPALTAEASGATAIELGWEAVDGAVRYELWAWWDNDSGWQRLGGGSLTDTTYTHSNLTAGTTYYYQVQAVDAGGVKGAWSQRVHATPVALAAPALTADASGATAIELNWTEVEGAARYELWAWWDDDSGWQRLGGDSLAATSYTHGNLTAGTTYYYQVQAVDAGGVKGAWSQRVHATPAALAAPELTAQASGATAVELSWTEVEGAARYELWAWDSENGWQRLGGANLTGTTYTHANLTAGATYYYQIQAVDAGGAAGAWSERVFATPVALPATPVALAAPALTAKATGPTTVQLSWTEVEGAARYELWAWWDDDTGWQRLGDNNLTGASYIHADLSAATTYYYQIQAVDAGGAKGAWSASVSAATSAPNLDREALTALYRAANGGGWTSSDNWLSDEPLSRWHGVLTSDNGRVIGLILTENGLRGKIPPELGNLSKLIWLRLGENELSGPIPSQLGNIANLARLNLDNNELSGTIPPELGNLSNLELLALGGNELSGSIPSQLGNLSNLTRLDLDNNRLSGPVPSQLGNLSNLIELTLFSNQLSGTIPPELGNLTELTLLDLGRNQLSGSIPSQLGNLYNLIGLGLFSNQLSGPIPSQLGNLVNLTVLILGNNQLSGSIPPQLGNLSNLGFLRLDANQLSGSIPSELGNLANLIVLSLFSNQLSGPIPSQLGNLSNLTGLYLYSNQLSGPIPSQLGNLSNLTRLSLRVNKLSGSIPPELGNLSNLTGLYLYSNQLSGSIPVPAGQPLQPGTTAPRCESVERFDPVPAGQPLQPGTTAPRCESVERFDPVPAGQPLQPGRAGSLLEPVERADPVPTGQPLQPDYFGPRQQRVEWNDPAGVGQPLQPGAAESLLEPVERFAPAGIGQPHQPGAAGARAQPVERFDPVPTGQSLQPGRAGSRG